MEPFLGLEFFLFMVLLGASAFFSSSETALFSLGRLKLEKLLGGRDPRAETIARLLERPRRLLTSIIIGNEMVNIAASAIMASIVIAFLGPGRSWVSIIIMTPLLMLFGEVTPKSLAVRHNERLALLLARPMAGFTHLVSPLRWVFLQLSDRLIRLLGGSGRGTGTIMEEEIKTIVDLGHEEGVLEETEREVIHKIFEFGDTLVSEIMVPRPDIFCLADDMSLGEVMARIREKRFSRIPIYHGEQDNVVGVLYAKELLHLVRRRDVAAQERLPASLLKEPLFVPSGKKTGELFRELQLKRTHIALVVDEHGDLAGLVTMEDLLEEIFGEIADEAYRVAEPWHEDLGGGAHLFTARVSVGEFARVMGWSPPDTGAETLGGLVSNLLGRIPSPGESISHGGLRFTVAAMRGRRILKVRVEPVEKRP